MPNHCGNRLVVEGPASDVDKFIEFAKGKGPKFTKEDFMKDMDRKMGKDPEVDTRTEGPLDLNKFVMCPESIEEKGYSDAGYDWCHDAWGTKWGCYEIDFDDTTIGTTKVARYTFKTAWSPFKLGVLVAMSKRFKSLEFDLKFAERGMEFYGNMKAFNGKGIYTGDKKADDSVPHDYQDLYDISG